MNKTILLASAASVLLWNCSSDNSQIKNETTISNDVSAFLDSYNKKYQELITKANDAQWKTQVYIVKGDTATSNATERAAQALVDFTGSIENIEKIKKFLEHKDSLNPLQAEELEHILYFAGGSPQTVADVVKERIKVETGATEKLYGFDYKLDGKSVTTNKIDEVLRTENNMDKRLKAWESSKEVGKGLKETLVKLRELRNKTVQGLNYTDYYQYQIADYGMTTDEMMQLLRNIKKQVYPLYRELHTFARYELSKKYGAKDVPDYLPAHWLPNRWGQDWSDIVTVKGFDLDKIIKEKKYTNEWIVQQAERFYVSMGFPSLPKTFWEKSDLYPLQSNADHKKNNHASAWHINLDQDVRSLMSVEPNAHWYETTHHELGHIYYYLAYSNPDVPMVLREGANRGYHEALGSMMGMAAMQKPFLVGLGLMDAKTKTDSIQSLLKEALSYIVAITWQTGTMSEFEYDLYAKNLPQNEYNKRWWELVKSEQGIVPPTERGEEFCDAATKTHIIDDPGQYYDYAIASVLMYQFHDYISKNILHQDPHSTNYFGNKQIGEFVGGVMKSGAVGDWRKLLKDKTGEELSARAMLDYFSPLMNYLKKENAGRKYTLPETRD
ncbi:MAG: M2 family metallopeptidase [Bacteroidia bacterium]|nr:M2 family metallopeptidase [Bacteroidia bacterium]